MNGAEPYTLRTLAGKPNTAGSNDGTNDMAGFNSPAGLALDGGGNAYVGDGNAVRKVVGQGTNWVVTTLAGVVGSHGAVDATGPAARFNYPQGVATDAQGNVYVADTLNDSIRKVTPTGVVTTLAGLAGIAGTADGTNSAARFDNPQGITALSDGQTLFVADTYNHAIRQVKQFGTNWAVTAIAGLAGTNNFGTNNGTGSAARFNLPVALTRDTAGQLFVADFNNHCIRKVALSGGNWMVTTFAGLAGTSGSADGTGSTARFNHPDGIAADGQGNLFVSDGDNHTLRKIRPSGEVLTIGGFPGVPGYANGTGGGALMQLPYGIGVDGAGVLYLSDSGNFVVRQAIPPALSIARLGNNVVLSWPAGVTGAVLQTRASLPAGTWTTLSNGILTSGNLKFYTNSISGSSNYWRLGLQ